jgi:murein DD-endopeptidase MepM/ murein hydrolase activator NlpD
VTLLPYALGQASRLRQGLGAISGNSVVIAPPGSGVFVAVMHLQAESIRVSVGQTVSEGEPIATCGNSGNSTQPHVHVQAMDRLDPWTAQGIPMRIGRFYEKPRRAREFVLRESTMPSEGATVKSARS